MLVSVAIHLRLWFDGYRDIQVVGPAFMVNAVAGVVIAVLLLTWRRRAPLLLAEPSKLLSPDGCWEG